jgi:hypothetical protein
VSRKDATSFAHQILTLAQECEPSAVILPHHKIQLATALVGTDFLLPELLKATKTEANDWDDDFRKGQAGNLLVSKVATHALIARKRDEEARKTKEVIARATAQVKAEAEAEWQAKLKADEEESLLVEDSLGA